MKTLMLNYVVSPMRSLLVALLAIRYYKGRSPEAQIRFLGITTGTGMLNMQVAKAVYLYFDCTEADLDAWSAKIDAQSPEETMRDNFEIMRRIAVINRRVNAAVPSLS